MSIRVVTDSSCDLPQPLVDALGIEIVPLTIRFGDEEFVDREELSTDEFWHRLEHSKLLPETAAPSAGAFESEVPGAARPGRDRHRVHQPLLAPLGHHAGGATGGGRGVRRRPGAGHRLAERVDGPRQPLSHRGAAGGRRRLARVDRARGGRPARPHQALRHARHARVPQAGGRIGNAHALLGTVLSIKPVIEVREGDRRGGGQGAHAIEGAEAARREGGGREDRAPRGARTATHPTSTSCSTLLEPIFPRDDIITGVVGPVIGTHAGPRVIGVTLPGRPLSGHNAAVELTTPGRVLGGRYRLGRAARTRRHGDGVGRRRPGAVPPGRGEDPARRPRGRRRRPAPGSATRRSRRRGLSHPNIVSTYDTGDDDGIAYIVMELVDGPTLRQLIDEHGGLPVADVIRIGKQVADALDAAHRAGLVHRDVKPANVLVPRDGPGEGHRLRHRQGRGRRRPHPHRHRDGHRPLPRARAGQRAPDRRPHRRLRARAAHVRGAVRPPAVRRRHRHRHRHGAPHHVGARRSASSGPRSRRRSTT